MGCWGKGLGWGVRYLLNLARRDRSAEERTARDELAMARINRRKVAPRVEELLRGVRGGGGKLVEEGRKGGGGLEERVGVGVGGGIQMEGRERREDGVGRG